MKLLTFLKTNLIFIAIIIALIAFGIGATKWGLNQKKEKDIQTENVIQLNKTNQVLLLNYDQLKDIHTKDVDKLDSLYKAQKIKPKSVISATIINTVHKDTNSIVAVHGKPQDVPQKPNNTINKTPTIQLKKIPVEVPGVCWYMKGYILTHDPESKLTVTERGASNSAQLVVQRKRVWLFFWNSKKATYKAYSDCGDSIQFTHIDFK